MNSIESEKIIKKLSDKYNLSETAIRKIIMSQFSFLRKRISVEITDADKYHNIRLRKFGIFYIPEFKREYIRGNINRKKNGEDIRTNGSGQQTEEGR